MTTSTGTGGLLPLVPLSPLVKTSIQAKEAYAQATDKLAQAKHATHPRPDVNSLRRLIEDTKVERRRLETCEQQMESVESATAFSWDPIVLARQVAAVDCQLFGMVILDKKWLCQLDRHQTHLDRLLDFQRYLTHSFAHQLIYWSELSTAVASQHAAVVPVVNPKDNLVQHLVRVAYLLAHAYRDFNGFVAIMRALMLPEVRRLKRLWQTVPARTHEVFAELATVLSPADSYAAYHDALRRKLDLFSERSGTIAIPWIQPHFASIQSIIKEYGAASSVVLSAPGARKLSAVVELLELCQQGTHDPTAATSNSNKRVSLKPIHLEGLRTTIVPPGDLNRLLPGDLVVHHWLVSRVYLTKPQLIDESIQVEPLAPDETLTRDQDEHEVEELELVEAAVVQDITLHPTAASPRPSSISDMDDPHQQQKKPLSTLEEQPEGFTVTNSTEEEDEPVKALNVAASPVNTKAEVPSSDIPPDSVATTAVKEIKPVKNPLDVTTESSNAHSRELSQTSSKKSRLSPTAPEFIPSTKTLPTPPGVTATTTAPAKSGAAVDNNNSDNEDDSDEEWRGYLYYERKGKTDPETWNGYPSPSLGSSQSDRSEEWKGYHASKMEEDWQQEINCKVEDRDWQGYTLETLNEDELDSSTMMDGEFEKSRQARRQGDTLNAFRRIHQHRQTPS